MVFDTGMHPELEHDTVRMRSTAPLFHVEQSRLGHSPASSSTAAWPRMPWRSPWVSHLHFDHAGGLGQLPSARVLVQAAEWDVAFDERLVDFGVYNPDDFDLGHDRVALHGEHDLFGATL